MRSADRGTLATAGFNADGAPLGEGAAAFASAFGSSASGPVRLASRTARLAGASLLALAALGSPLPESCMGLCPSPWSARAATSPADEPYSISYAAGGHDSRGNFLGGTEFINLVAFQGKLYGGIGYWMDDPNYFSDHPDPPSGAQIVVLDSKRTGWRQEAVFNQRNPRGRFSFTRLSSMDVVSFHNFDANGNNSGVRANFLIASLDGPSGALYAQAAPGSWVDLKVPTSSAVRAFIVHYDPVAKADLLFAGSGKLHVFGAINSGVYVSSASGPTIQWNSNAEVSDLPDRVMSFVNCGGRLFAAAKPSIYERDDSTGQWREFYTYNIANPFDQTKYVSGFRALTCIDDPNQPGQKAILTGFEGSAGDILHINIQSGQATSELRARQLLTQSGLNPGKDIIEAYSAIPELSHNNQNLWLFGTLHRSVRPDQPSSAWLLSRSGTNSPGYSAHEVRALSWPYQRSDQNLWSIRTIAVSPFPEDQGKVLYIGGYDGHFRPDHNTAWLYRVGINTVMGED